MTCTTCHGLGYVIINGHQKVNCPVCAPVYNEPGPTAPEPIALTLHCDTVTACSPIDMDYPVRAIISGVAYDDILFQVPIAESVKYYSSFELLKAMPKSDIDEYYNSTYGTDNRLPG